MDVSTKTAFVAAYQQKVYDAGYAAGMENAEPSDNPFVYATWAGDVFTSSIFPNNYDLELVFSSTSIGMSNILKSARGLRSATITFNSKSLPTRLDYAFQSCQAKIINFPNGVYPSTLAGTFASAAALHTITGEIDASACTSFQAAFSMATALVEIRFKPGSINAAIDFSVCGRLSAESKQSIIDGLAEVDDRKPIKFSASVLASLTEEQIGTIQYKGWDLS